MSNNNEALTSGAVPAVVNQYGDHPINIGRTDNLHISVFTNQNSESVDENGVPFTPIVATRYDRNTRTIFLGNETIKLPVELVPQEEIDEKELPCVNALCEVYAEKLSKAVTPNDINSLPAALKKNYSSQMKAYYSAELVQHSVREVFADGESQFQALKDDAFAGIEPTYLSDRYTSGYERLEAVLEKITNITLSGSTLTNVMGLIGNLEKRGICHILVNDDCIRSWVNIDE